MVKVCCKNEQIIAQQTEKRRSNIQRSIPVGRDIRSLDTGLEFMGRTGSSKAVLDRSSREELQHRETVRLGV